MYSKTTNEIEDSTVFFPDGLLQYKQIRPANRFYSQTHIYIYILNTYGYPIYLSFSRMLLFVESTRV